MTPITLKSDEKTARTYDEADGWVAHVITNVWGFTAPGESASWGAEGISFCTKIDS
jgi:alpha-L-fucosidase 2